MAKRKTYDGAEISVSFDMARCIHARNCFLKLPRVFDPSRRPWIDPDAAPAEEIAAMIRTCPSGALTFRRRDGGTEAPPGVNRAAVLENGPIALAGEITLGEAEEETRMTLCRCGKSKTKPYCDYSHVEAGFTATGEPPATDEDKAEGPGGPLNVTAVKNGPLVITGNLEITTGTGARVARTAKAFLCRCGASKNKPFCDGSHKEIGFTSEGD